LTLSKTLRILFSLPDLFASLAEAARALEKVRVMSSFPMKRISQLSDSALLTETHRLCTLERKTTLEILHHLREIEFRALFARNHASLFEFCIKELGFTEDQASRRISSMRLLKAVPEVEGKVASGELKLNQLAQVQTFIRTEKKEAGRQVSQEETRSLLLELSGKSSRETERLLLEKSPALQAKRQSEEKLRAVTATHTEIKFVADQELLNLLEEAKGLLAHGGDMNPSLSGLFKKALECLIEKKKHQRGLTASRPNTRLVQAPVAQQVKPQTRTLSAPIKRQTFQRAQGRCEFVKQDGNRCSSIHALEVHHVHPFAKGGPNTADNLKLFCRTHNAAQGKWDFPRLRTQPFNIRRSN
jgi:5-methylcytosine-specific restriction endonuclease McrA